MEIKDFLNLKEEAQKEYILELDNNTFNDFIQQVKKKNLKLSMTLSSHRQSNKNIKKKETDLQSQIGSTKLELYKIEDNPEQPRKKFTEADVKEKVESIRSRGLITPITILKKDDKYILIAGQLRLEAFKKLNQEEKIKNISSEDMKYSKINVFIKDEVNYNNDDLLIDSLTENLNRKDMNVVDTAKSLKRIQELTKKSQGELEKILGKSKFYISSYLTIANADQEFLDYVLEKDITQPTIIYLILQLNKSLNEKKLLVDKYLNGEIKKIQLQDMKNAENEVKSKKEKKFDEVTLVDTIFTFKKEFNLAKYKKLGAEKKESVDKKLEEIKRLQEEIKNLF